MPPPPARGIPGEVPALPDARTAGRYRVAVLDLFPVLEVVVVQRHVRAAVDLAEGQRVDVPERGGVVLGPSGQKAQGRP